MAIYIDSMEMQARVGRLSARWSHLLCGPFDDLAELHEFADAIGLRRAWFQDKPWPAQHYDVTATKRSCALARGAIAISWRDTGKMMVMAKKILAEFGFSDLAFAGAEARTQMKAFFEEEFRRH